VQESPFPAYSKTYLFHLVHQAHSLPNKQFVHDAELPRDFHGPVDRAEMNDAVQAVMADPRAKEEIKRLKIDNTTVALDPWDYGVHGKETQTRRTQVGDIVLV
jgi:primary-amine oxidase